MFFVTGVLKTAFSDLMLLYVRSNVQSIHSIIGLCYLWSFYICISEMSLYPRQALSYQLSAFPLEDTSGKIQACAE